MHWFERFKHCQRHLDFPNWEISAFKQHVLFSSTSVSIIEPNMPPNFRKLHKQQRQKIVHFGIILQLEHPWLASRVVQNPWRFHPQHPKSGQDKHLLRGANNVRGERPEQPLDRILPRSVEQFCQSWASLIKQELQNNCYNDYTLYCVVDIGHCGHWACYQGRFQKTLYCSQTYGRVLWVY